MFGYFGVTLIFYSVYVCGARSSIGLLTILDIEQNILRITTFHWKSQRGGLSKYRKISIKQLHHIECTAPVLNI